VNAHASALSCRHEGRCGGCSSLRRSPGEQLATKQRALASLLGDLLPADVPIGITPPNATPIHTRTKLSWPVRHHGKRGLEIGMFARGTHELVPIRECWLGDPALTQLQARAADVLRSHGLTGYSEATERGLVRAFHARFVSGSGELVLGLTTGSGAFPQARAVAADLLAAADGLTDRDGRPLHAIGVVRSALDGPSNALLGQRQETLAGRDHVIDEVDGLRIRVSFESFYQSHRDAADLLFRPALEMLGPVDASDRVVDGYGGVGTFGLRLARSGAGVVELVESSASATRDAAHNAHINGLLGVQIHDAPFGRARLEPHAQAVVVDPPRKGLGEDGVAQVLHLQAPRVLYVSCGPKALARDLVPLLAADYRLAAVQIADLFPYTDHFETLCLLHRVAGGAKAGA